jgi:hypothetical protein
MGWPRIRQKRNMSLDGRIILKSMSMRMDVNWNDLAQDIASGGS